MANLGLSEEERRAVLDVTAACLHISAIRFEKDAATGGKEFGGGHAKCSVADEQLLHHIAHLLHADWGELKTGMTSNVVRNSVTVYSLDKARKNRDAFAQSLFAALFDWLVTRINESGKEGPQEGARAGLVSGRDTTRKVGILDIFGFEIFELNSLEQLLINYANERLQRNFTDAIFR
jgi:myosin heavy subunit